VTPFFASSLEIVRAQENRILLGSLEIVVAQGFTILCASLEIIRSQGRTILRASPKIVLVQGRRFFVHIFYVRPLKLCLHRDTQFRVFPVNCACKGRLFLRVTLEFVRSEPPVFCVLPWKLGVHSDTPFCVRP
jgi:hypothetical protein